MKTNEILSNRSVRIGLVVALVLLLGSVPVLAYFAFQVYGQPLGPALSALAPSAAANTAAAPVDNTTAALATTNQTAGEAASNPSANPSAVLADNNTTSPQVNTTEVCGEKGVWNLLILGSDTGETGFLSGSDLTRAAQMDFSNKKVTIYAFPRDLWVKTTNVGFTNPAIDFARLSEVFKEARSRSKQTNLQGQMSDGANATAIVMAQNFNLHFDHYMAVDLAQLPAMVDAIGGVTMNVPNRTTDQWIGMVIQEGQQTLNGKQAAAYARAKPDSDFGRIVRDNLLMDAMRQKLSDPALWVKIPQLYSQFKDVIATDLSPSQIVDLGCMMKSTPKESILQDAVNAKWTKAGPQESLLWDSSKVSARLKELGLTQQ